MDEVHRMLLLVKDPNPQIRKYALTQVEHLADGVDDEEVLEVLREAARDTVPLVSHQAIRSLARLLGQAFLAESGEKIELGDGNFEGVSLLDLRTAGLDILSDAIRRLEDIVRGSDKRAARRALIALGKIAAPDSTAVVASCLNDPALAGAAAIALPGIGGEEALKPLLAAARDEQSPGRLHAVLELGRFDEPPSRALLLELAKNENAAIRANAAMALGQQAPGPDGREVLGTLLGDAEVWVTVYAIRSLARDRSQEAAQLVATAFHRVEDPHVQASCLAVLGGMGPVAYGPAEPVLHSGITHPDDRVRANAVEAASRLIEDPAVLGQLIGPLSTDPNNRVLANVAVGLAKYDIASSLEILRRLSGVDDKWFQTSAAWAAGAIGAPETFPILTDLLQSHETAILLMVVRSLESFPKEESLPLLQRLSAHSDSLVRARAAEVMGRFGGEQVGQILTLRFQSEADEVSRAALVNALATTRASGVSTVLIEALNDPHPRVQANAVEALGRVGSLDVLSVVRPFAGGEKNRLRANAWIALWRLGDMDMAQEAARSLVDSDPAGLPSSIYAVGEMGRELRQLSQTTSNLLLLSALKDRAGGGSSAPLISQTVQMAAIRKPQPPHETLETRDPNNVELAVEGCLEKLLLEDLVAFESAVHLLPPGTPPGIGTYLLHRGKLAQKDQAEALRLLEDACSQGVGCVSAHLELANFYLRNRRDKDAAVRFLSAFSTRRKAFDEITDCANRSLEDGDLTKVSRVLKFLFGQGPMSADTNVKVGRELLAAGMKERAFHYLFLARVEAPRDPGVALDYGIAGFRLGRLQLAKKLSTFVRRSGAQEASLLKRLQALDAALGRGNS